MVTQEQIRQAVTAYFAGNNALDADAIGALFTLDARMERVPGTSPATGRAAIRHVYAQLFAGLAEARVTAVHTLIAGNGVAVYYRGELTARRGGEVAVEGIDTFEIDAEGQIAAICFYWDPTPLAALLRG
ncbi:MAG: nuclear transport factor 2 family protein [Thermomicrobiales bacterium]